MTNRMRRRLLPLVLALLLFSPPPTASYAWGNGGYSSDPSNPDYGTHDWVAEHALEMLPSAKRQWLADNLKAYLYGTELPDNNRAADGIGDMANHHVYFRSGGSLHDDAAARRAQEEYQAALNYLKQGDYINAAKRAGAMAHYVSDVAVFSHVMGSSTDWGAEVHHGEYEEYVNAQTSTYSSSFRSYLSFDGGLEDTTAYEVALNLARDTTFDSGGTYTATWMDGHYDTSSAAFLDRAGESLNLAVNGVADALSALYDEAHAGQGDQGDNSMIFYLIGGLGLAFIIALFTRRR